jgi:hypothetical protein
MKITKLENGYKAKYGRIFAFGATRQEAMGLLFRAISGKWA